jgi:hypothetical protein
MRRLSDNGLITNDCDLADVTDFPGRTEFTDLEVPDTSSATCPEGFVPTDTDGDGVVDACTGGGPATTEPPTSSSTTSSTTSTTTSTTTTTSTSLPPGPSPGPSPPAVSRRE